VLRNLMFSVLCLVGTTGCAEESGFPGTGAKTEQLPIGPGVDAASHADACRRTGGDWRGGLQACLCAKGQLFSATRGCDDVASYLVKPELGGLRVGALLVAMDSGHDARGAWADDLSARLAGAMVEAGQTSRPLALVGFEPLNEARIDADIAGIEQRTSGRALVTTYDTDVRDVDPVALHQSCQEVLGEGGIDGVSSPMCRDLVRAIRLLASPAARVPTFFEKVVRPGNPTIHLSVAKLGGHEGHAVAKVLGIGGVPVIRVVTLRGDDEEKLDVLLNPRGGVQGGRLEFFLPAEADSGSVMVRTRLYLGPNFAPLRLVREFFGDKAEIAASMEANTGREPVPPAFTGRALASASVVFLEKAVDPRVGPIFQRVLLTPSDILESQVSRGQAWILDIITSDPGRDDGHGTEVASVLTAELRKGTIQLFPMRNNGWLKSPKTGRQRLVKALRETPARVVNISQAFDDDIADCDAFFRPIFDAFRDSKLFVVAAGNDGSEDHPTVCPGSLGHRYVNVVAVGGTQGGRMHPSSNFGSATVDVAAPFCAQVQGGPEAPLSVHEACGTSFAAPVVASIAVEAFERVPSISASAVKAAMLRSCSPQGLRVRCGGALQRRLLMQSIGAETP
jgi:hypothetical protein